LSAEQFSKHLYDAVKEDLEGAYMNRRWRHNCQYEFSGSNFRFIWNGFNKFNGVKGCQLEVSKELGLITLSAKYDFSEVFVLCLLFCMIPLTNFWGLGSHRLLLLLIIWTVYFANFIISYLRLNTYFKRMVKDTYIDFDKSYEKKLL
jgi:fatty acid desaturase